MTVPVRVRYAPSPTGDPHVGNIRTALFNWLYARHTGGKFILRVEDTDVARTEPGALESILESLRWLGLDWDEGPEVGGPHKPYFQSQRLPIYHEVSDRLLAQGDAYLCYCSTQRLDEMRKEQQRQKMPPKYDRRCRELSEAEAARMKNQGITPVVRFMTPLEGENAFRDYIRDEVAVENSTLDDFVLLKSDGFPTYHLANVVDDHLMEISHVLRAEEWLPSTPRHLLLYQALGYEPPVFAHMPLILGTDRAKLSKRHGATSTLEYRDRGYLPEAMVNFLSLLGWSLDDKTEILSRDELIQHFSIDRVGKTGAIFNIEKLDWMNGVYIRNLPVETLAETITPWLERDLPTSVSRPLDKDYIVRITALIQERLKLLKEAAELTEFFFLDDPEYDAALLLGRDLDKERATAALESAKAALELLPEFTSEAMEPVLRGLSEKLGLRTGPFFGLLRVATTGRTAAPPLFQTMEVLGRERCFGRIEVALGKLQN